MIQISAHNTVRVTAKARHSDDGTCHWCDLTIHQQYLDEPETCSIIVLFIDSAEIVEAYAAAINGVADTNTIDWADNNQITRALGRGLLPPGYFTNTDGVLIVPDENAEPFRVAGHNTVVAYYGEVVTRSGRIVKSQGGAA